MSSWNKPLVLTLAYIVVYAHTIVALYFFSPIFHHFPNFGLFVLWNFHVNVMNFVPLGIICFHNKHVRVCLFVQILQLACTNTIPLHYDIHMLVTFDFIILSTKNKRNKKEGGEKNSATLISLFSFALGLLILVWEWVRKRAFQETLVLMTISGERLNFLYERGRLNSFIFKTLFLNIV